MKPWTRSLTSWFRGESKVQPKRCLSTMLTVEQLEGREMLSASPIAFKPDSQFYSSLEMNGTFFFSTSGGELWKTNGTTAGTVLVKDLDPMGSIPSGPVCMTNFDGLLYFYFADPSNNIMALWKSDGTAAGTALVKDLGIPFSRDFQLQSVIADDTLFLFTRNDERPHDWQLWRSDGSTAGTFFLKDFGQPGGDVSGLSVLGGAVVFFTQPNVPYADSQLWRSDGTVAGTFQVRELNRPGEDARALTVANGWLFFETFSDSYQIRRDLELWKTDGTSSSTSVVKDMGEEQDPLTSFFDLNGALYFSDNSGKLWKTDGLDNDVVLVKSFPGLIEDPTPFDGGAVFIDDLRAEHGGVDLFKTDGTANGTVFIRHFASDLSIGIDPLFLSAGNGSLFIVTGDGVVGLDLWSSDGTDAGTVLLQHFTSDGAYFDGHLVAIVEPFLSNVGNFQMIGGTLYFNVSGPTKQLWQSDGTEAGTKIIVEEDRQAYIHNPAVLANGTVVFFNDVEVGDSGLLQPQVWALDASDLPPSNPIDLSTLDPKPVEDPEYFHEIYSANSVVLVAPATVNNPFISTNVPSSSAADNLNSSASPSTPTLAADLDSSATDENIADSHSTLGSVQTSMALTIEATLATEANENGTHGKASLNQEADSQKADRIGAPERVVAQAEKQSGPITSQARVVVGIDDGDAEADLGVFFISDQSTRERDSNEVNS
jgi:ELWxxDGT repeat protein